MFHHKNTQTNLKSRKNSKKSTHKIPLDILKPLTQLVDQTAFLQNLDELYEFMGVKQLNPDSQSYKDVRNYLTQVLKYPNRSLAKLHRQSHRLGTFDKLSSQQTNQQNLNNLSQSATLIDQIDNCPCCGLRKQLQELKICSTSFKDLQIVGISTYMFFRTMRNVLYFLIVSLIVFGAFSFASNIKCSNLWNNSNVSKAQLFTNTILISLGSKIYLTLNGEYQDLLIWQVWLGLAMVVIFMFGYVWMQKVQVKEISEIDYETKSVSDYSIVLKGVPAGVTKQEVQSALDSLFDQNNQQIAHKVVKINCGTPINISSEIQQQHKSHLLEQEEKNNQYKQQIFSWIKELRQNNQFSTLQQERQKIIKEYEQSLKQSEQNQQQIVTRVKQLYQQNKVDTITDCFVTFQSRNAKQHLLDSISSGAFAKFFQYLTLNIYKKTIKVELGQQGNRQQYHVKIEQASQPQDIIWRNIGMRTVDLILRKCVTFLFTFVLLGMSFAVMYGLSTVQVKNQQNRYISFLISLTIVIFNFIISVVLAIFTAYELNSSHTDYQSSYAVKAIFAQLINTILIPILVNRFLKKENYIYSTSGLADDVFLLGLTNAFIKPLVTIFDPYYFFIKYLRVWYCERPQKKVLLNQVQFNRIYELMLFQSGFEYIYIISLYLWTCFFMSLQPIIIAFSIIGLIMNYWAIKYALFHRCKRPVPGSKILYDTMVQFVYAGGLFYALGSLSFINLIPKDIFSTQINFALIANLIAIGLSALSLFIPFSYLYALVFDTKKQESDEFYQKNRILFPTEYDRMNPATSEKAITEYLNYINDKKIQIRKRPETNDTEMQKFFKTLSNQCRNVYERGIGEYNPIGNFFSPQNKLTELLNPKIEMVHPRSIENYLICDIQQNLINKKENQTKNEQLQRQHRNEIHPINQNGSDVRLFVQNQLKQDMHKSYEQNYEPTVSKRALNDQNSLNSLNKKIYRKIVNMTEPLQNNISYAKSPYNPSALQQFKNKTNKMFINKMTSSKIIHDGDA